MNKSMCIAIASLIMLPALATERQETRDETTPRGGTWGMVTTYGPTGLISVPSAYTSRAGEAAVGGSWGKELSGPGANYGLVQWVEVGGAFVQRRGSTDKGIGSAKVTLLPQNFDWLTVGVGTIDAFDAIRRTWYVVGSADLTPPEMRSKTGAEAIGLRVHAGVGSGLYRERLIAGGELMFADSISVVAEYDARNFNAALRYRSKNDVQVQAGARDKGLFFGMTGALRF